MNDNQIYKAMSFTAVNAIGCCINVQNLRNFAAKVCRIDEIERLMVDREIDALPKIKKQLKGKFVKADNLLAKDANCLSDPYCKLSLSGRKVRVKTSTMYATCNPIWNEEFMIDLHDKDIEKREIKVEIWDEDPKELCKVLGEVRNLKWGGFGHFVRDVGETIFASCLSINTDDFIGKASVPLKNLSYDAREMELKLAGRGKKKETVRGTLYLALQLQCKRVISHKDSVKQHLLLHEVCAEYCAFNSSLEYRTLLVQHAAQNGIDDLEQTMCRCIASLKSERNSNSEQPDYEECFENLVQLRSWMTTNSHVCQFLKEWLNEALQKHVNISAEIIKNDYLGRNVPFLLKCMSVVKKLKNVKIILPEIHQAIIDGARSWLETIFSEHKEELEQMSTAPQTLQDIFKLLFNRMRKANEEFEEHADCPYFIFVYKELDRAVAANYKPVIERCCHWSLENQNLPVQLSLLPVYLRVKLLWNYVKPMQKDEEQLHLAHYSDWFPEEIMESWFDMQTEVLTKYIETAVAHRSIEEPFDDIIKHLTKFQEVLEWPRKTSLICMFRILCRLVKTFANKMSEQLLAETIGIEASLEQYCQATCLIKGAENYISHNAKSKVLNIISGSVTSDEIYCLEKDTIKHMEMVRQQIHSECIAAKISDEMFEPIHEIGACKDKDKSKTLLIRTSRHLFQLIGYLYKNLDNEIFKGVLKYIWSNILTLVEQTINDHNSKATFSLFRSNIPYEGMLNLLEELISMFKASADKIGLEEHEMDPKRINEIREQLEKRTRVVKPEIKALPQPKKSWINCMASFVTRRFSELVYSFIKPGSSKTPAEENQGSLMEQQPPMMAPVPHEELNQQEDIMDVQEDEHKSGTPTEENQRPLMEQQPPMMAPLPHEELNQQEDIMDVQEDERKSPRKSWTSFITSMAAKPF